MAVPTTATSMNHCDPTGLQTGTTPRAGAAPILAVRQLSFGYPNRPVLHDVTFSVQPGERFGFLGPNGSGKTTLFRLLSTLMRSEAGEMSFFGQDIPRGPVGQRALRDVRRRLGVVFQNPGLDRQLTVRENLSYQGALFGLRGAALSARVDEVIAQFDLSAWAGEFVKHLSGGWQRRVELAKSLLHRPSALLLDEPTVGLDPSARRLFWDTLDALRRRDALTVVFTTHVLDDAERSDRLAILDRGRIVRIGEPSALKDLLGGDVVTVTADDPEALCLRLNERFGVRGTVFGGTVRLEGVHGQELVPAVLQAFPEAVRSVTSARPTLEDVFIHATGHQLQGELLQEERSHGEASPRRPSKQSGGGRHA